MICLDTNAVIAVLNSRATPVRTRLQTVIRGGETVAVPALVLFELWYGAANSVHPERSASRIADFMSGPIEMLPLDAEDAREAGEIRATLDRAGTLIGPYDLLIAAQARRRNAVLVTSNLREFARVAGLSTEDWSTG